MITHPSERGRILIVDNDQKVRELLVDMLQEEGYDVVQAREGVAALDLAVSFEPDVVVSDVVMPLVDGLELCRSLKRDKRTASIPVLLVSGARNSQDDGIEGLNAGADDYLALPFRNDELLVKVARLAERRRVEKHYREIVEQAADIIYARDMEGYLTTINASGSRFFGRPADDLVGTHLSAIIGNEAAAHDIEETRSAPPGGLLRSVYRLPNAQGNWRYLEAVVTVDHDRTGRPTGVRGVVRDITEQKLAEEALKESEERYRRLVELSPQAIVVHRDGKFVYLNPAALKLWAATSSDQLVGKPVLDVVHPDYRDLVRARVAQVQDRGQPAPLIEEKCVRLDGEIIDVEVAGMPFTLEGKPAVQAVIRDVTERKRAREALKETEARLRTVVGSASLILFALDKNGIFTLCEGEGLKALGLKPADVVGKSVFELYRNEPQLTANISRAFRGESFSSAVELGDLVFDARYSPLTDENNDVIGVIGVATDITESRKAEESIRESEERYRELFENANDIIYTHDLAGNFTSLNRSGETITGYSREEAMKMNVADVLAPGYLDLARQMIAQKTAGNAPTVYELEIISKDRRRVRLEVSTRLVYREGKPVGVQGIGRDLTERRRAEKALGQQARREAMTHRISQTIRRSLDSAEVFRTAVRELGSHLNVDRCSLFMKDERAKCATNVAEYHAEGVEPAATDFALADLKALIKALDENGVLAFDDAAHDVRIAEVYERILAKADVRSIMYVAIRVGDEVPAAFALSTTRGLRSWSEVDITLAKAVADQTGIAIRQAELYQRAEATSTRESLVNRVTMAIRASLSLSEVLSTATRELGRALLASRVLLHLYDLQHPSAPVEYVAPGNTSIKHLEVRYDDPISRELLSSQKPIVIDDALNYGEGAAEFSAYVQAYASRVNLRSEISYPLIVKGSFRGVLCIQQTERIRRWTEDELALVEAVAERLAVGIAQAELFEMVTRAKNEWETTFDAMSDGVFIFDRAGILRRVNRAGAAMEATHSRALQGRKCCEILRTNLEDEACVVEKAFADARSVTIEITPERLDRPLLVSVEPVFDYGDKPVAVVCTARDLSELRNVQAMAREHQSLLTNILESARESIYAVDPDGRFKWCNSATLAGLGWEREQLIGRHLLEMVYEGDHQLVQKKLEAAFAGQPQTYEMRYFASDGRLRYARVDNSPLVMDTKITGVLGIARDTTEQKEERERAARADKLRALGQLASGVAHDFNNSLAAILGRAQLLRRQTRDDAVVRNLEIIETAAQDAAATVRRIQTFARKSPVKEFERLDVCNLLNDAIEITRTRWENEARVNGLDYQVKLEAESGLSAYGSASELREVFVNLIVNAVDAMPKGGQLAISCVRDQDRVRLQFADSGVGMPEDVRQKIFEPFFTTKGTQGTGLGLSVSHSIIERHEGTISVSSEPERGTVFTIDLPAADMDTAASESSVKTEATRSISILVIDDEAAVRETLSEMLVALNHQVTIAKSGQEGLQALERESFDLVFTDLAMPDMDGWETAREIRRRRPQLKIVLVTGLGPTVVPPVGEDDLVDGIIGKPFDFSQVNYSIRDIIARKKIELQNVDA